MAKIEVYFTQIDTVYEFYHSLSSMTDNSILVKLFNDENNFKIATSFDGANWNLNNYQISTDSLHPYGFDMQIVDNKTVAAWIDNRIGNYEIYYKLIDLPTLPLKLEDNTISDMDFKLFQNYSNLFNPST